MSRLRRSIAVLVLGSSALLSCDEPAAPRDQWTIFVGTDAAVPQFGDRLLIEIVDEEGGVCSSCRRQFGASDEAQWPFSIGVSPRKDGKRLGVRARLYRASITGGDGLPGSDRHIDAFAWLPDPVGIAEVGLSLPMSCFGVVAAVGESCDPSSAVRGPAPELEVVDDGAAAVLQPGTWAPLGPRGCEGVDAPPGEVCVPGGAFLLGAPEYLPLDAETIPVPEQLVALSPFLIDAEEMTVGKLSALVADGQASPALTGPNPFCTWGLSDDLPVNCITFEVARTACEAQGKRLPTEAEWEFVAGNLQRETDFPWVDLGVSLCDQAVVDQDHGVCRPSGEPIGPIAGGLANDVSLIGVHNLAGNVSEWVEDSPVAYDSELCWGDAARLLVDPRCVSSDPTISETHVIRGAAWSSDQRELRSSNRNAGVGQSDRTGFRCARTIP